jgi:hypothetical protein
MRWSSGYRKTVGLWLVQILTEEFAVDLGSIFALGKVDCLLFVTGNQSIQVKGTLR